MKSFIFFICICCLQTANGQQKQSKTTLLTVEDLQLFVSLSKTDSIVKLERLTALYFHEMLNEYRQKKKRERLSWDDTLWLAARNHAVWMMKNDKISHTQSTSSKAFTGKSYKDRITYVLKEKVSFNATGENALYNSNSGQSKQIDLWAKELANICFNQWKNSKDHHDNMIQKLFNTHGMAIIIDPNGEVYAVDLFVLKMYPTSEELIEN